MLSRRGTLADQVVRLERPERRGRARRRPRRRPGRRPVDRRYRRAAPEARVLQRARRLRRGGPRVRRRPGAGPVDAGALDQRHRQPVVRVPGLRVRSGYTWSENSRENQLTAWSNDAVSDPVSEAIYVRDDETGEVWGPTALPVRVEASTYVARHGPGFSRFQHRHDGIGLDLLQYVVLDEALKVGVLTIDNHSGRRRKLSVTAYAGWVLGTSRGAVASQIVTDRDPATGALLAHNPWNPDFGGRVAFIDLGGRQTAWTADRTEFLGRNGDTSEPAALEREHRLSGARRGCAGPLRSAPDEHRTGRWRAHRDRRPPRPGARCGRGGARPSGAAGPSITTRRCGRSRVPGRRPSEPSAFARPDRSMDILLNGWLLYQTLACRLWARAAFYQAGGAYGFRDQLQDIIALTISRPGLAREHLLRAAAHQFAAGDVQHWWHPPTGRGVRTRISDDRLWLPYALDKYMTTTGDTAILEEHVPFIDGPALNPGQDDAYFEPDETGETGTLYEHCVRAVEASLASGAHGLPLMGSGDWNDGMNRVGHEGRGESVWLGWFLHKVLATPDADRRGPRRRCPGRALDRPHEGPASLPRAPGLGRRLVPARLLR